MRSNRVLWGALGAMLLSGFAMEGKVVVGTVVSDRDSTALEGALCELRADTAVIARTAVGQGGRFMLQTDGKQDVKVTVSMTGYTPSEVMIPKGGHDLDIGAIFLAEGIALGEVTVTSQMFTDSRGRTIIYPSSSEVKGSQSAVSLFQKLPLAGLEANPITRSITVDGGAPVILINGVPASQNEFNALNPKDIERVEYSRFAPARYADKGNNGFLNIQLKKRTDGGSLYVWMRDCPYTGFLDGQLNTSYHQGPSQFTLLYNPSWRSYGRVYDYTEESYIAPDFRVNLQEKSRSPFYYLSNNLSFKYLYQPKSTTFFSATFNATIFSDDRSSHGAIIDTFRGDYKRDSKTKSKRFTPSLDLFFHHDFNGQNTLEAQVVGTLSSDDYRREYAYHYLSAQEDLFDSKVDNRRRSLISEVSYSHTFDFQARLSAGYQNTVSHTTNKYLDSGYKPILTENNNYAYIQYGQQVRRIYFSLSTGLKMFWMKNDLNRRHFIRNLSRVQVNWMTSDKWSLVAFFNYRPLIPGLAALTDYPQQTTPYILSNGNPDLKVSESLTYALGASFNYQKIRGGVQAQYMQIIHPSMQVARYLGEKMFISQSLNYDNDRSFYLSAYLNIPDFHGFGFNGQINLGHFRSQGNGWSEKLTSVGASINLWWTKGPFTVSYYRVFPAKFLSGTYVRKQENSDQLQVQYRPNKHWNLGVSWMYMFENLGSKYYSWNRSAVNPLYTFRNIESNANMVVFSATYSTDFGSIFRAGKQGLKNSDSGSSLLKL